MKRAGWRAVAMMLLGGLCAAIGATAAAVPPMVVVVVVEALRHDYPDRAPTPNLKRLAAEGGRAESLISVFPPNSLPCQATIASGKLPAGSGALNNRFYDRRLGRTFEGEPEEFAALLKAEPIWTAAARAGVAVGAINWMGAAGGSLRLAAARELLGRESQLFKAYLPSELPASYRYLNSDRTGDLILIGAAGTYFRDLGDRPIGPPKSPGAHGFAPEDRDMRGAFFAWGRGVRAGSRWPAARLVDLYPTLCMLLGIQAAAGIDGRPLQGLELQPPATGGPNGSSQ